VADQVPRRSVKFRTRNAVEIFIFTARNEDLAIGQQRCRRYVVHDAKAAGLPKFKGKTGTRRHERQHGSSYD
jgi:hypothetical protein